MNAVPLVRRFAGSALAIVISAGLFRAQISNALVTRGDDFLQAGNSAHAMAFYDRALLFDQTSPIAAERVTFVGMLTKTPAALRRGLAVATAELAAHPEDMKVRNDRGVINERLGRYREAYADFAALARRTNDAHYYEFAAQCAKKSGDRRTAAVLFARVIAIDPHFNAARRELAELHAE